MSAHVEIGFGDGTPGRALDLQGTVLLAVGEKAYAPGRPLELTLRFADGAGDVVVHAKTIGSKRRDADGLFDVRVRLVDLKRADRERLLTALPVA